MPEIVFFGTGSYLPFSLGVAKFLKERYFLQHINVVSSSGGAIAAIALLTLEISEFDSTARQVASILARLHRHPLAWFILNPTYRRLLEFMIRPSDLPKLRNRLRIATTSLPFLKPKLRTQTFTCPKKVVRHLQASSFIPLAFMRLPALDHLLDIDGGFSMRTSDFPTALIIRPEYKAGIDVFLARENVPVLKTHSYDDFLQMYHDGYQRASHFMTEIDLKLGGAKKNEEL